MKRYFLVVEDSWEDSSGKWVQFEEAQAELDAEREKWRTLNDQYMALKGEHEKLKVELIAARERIDFLKAH